MGEGINLRRGGKPKKLPILNPNLPANASVEYMGGATFNVEIVTPGYPEEYTYQWYKNGSAISGATETSYSVSSQTASAEFYCIVTSKAGSVQSRTATFTVGSALPNYTFSGGHQLVDDGSGNWRLMLTSTGTLRFANRGTGANGIDVFLVGGGAGGCASGQAGYGGGGGGGGRTKTVSGKAVSKNTDYVITVGGGGGSSANGGNTSAFDESVDGGTTGNGTWQNWGGSGGSGGGSGSNWSGNRTPGAGGSDGGSGGSGNSNGGAGQNTTTGEFGDSNATWYSAGGAGGACGAANGANSATESSGGAGGGGASGSAATYYGGGGGGGHYRNATMMAGGSGYSGIVIIRNKRG